MGEDDVGGGHVERGLGGVREPDHVADLQAGELHRVGAGGAEADGHVDRDLLQTGGRAGCGRPGGGRGPGR